MQVVFNDLAELELIEAVDYYEGEAAGLGEAFLVEVERGGRRSRSIPDLRRSSFRRYGVCDIIVS
jgi:hypothetical protein